MATKGKYGKIIFSDSDLQFIKDNFHGMTNQEIADAMGLKKTVVRTKAYSMGLRRMEMEYWNDEAVILLKENYHKIGNLELTGILNEKFPRKKGWKKWHITKKLGQLNLIRNDMDMYTIMQRNRQNGSFGGIKERNNRPPPNVYFELNAKTRIKLRPGQSTINIKEKYSNI